MANGAGGARSSFMGMRRITCIMALAMLLVLHGAAVFEAIAAPGVPIVRGSVIRDYARVTFQWPQNVRFKASSSGNRITLVFDKEAKPNFGALLKSLNPYITSASVAGDGKTVILSTNKPYRIRSFSSGNSGGIDILGVDPDATPKKDDTRKESANNKEEKPKDNKKSTPTAKKIDVAKTEKSKKEPAVKKEAKPQETPKSKTVITTAAPAKEDAKKGVHVVGSTEKSPPAADTPKPAESSTTPPPATAEATPPTVVQVTGKAGDVTMSLGIAKDAVQLVFPWKERVAASIFKRGEYLWVIFDNKTPISTAVLATNKPELISSVEPLAHDRLNILRFKLSRDVNITADKLKEDGTSWMVELTTRLRRPALAVNPTLHTDPPLKPYVFLPVLENTDPADVADPEIGDSLIIVPFFNPGQAVWPQRKFVEFNLLASAQGMVVQKLDDDTRVALTRNGIKVARVDGLYISAKLPQLPEEDPALYGEVADTLFPYQRWKLKEGEKLKESLQQQRIQITKASDPDKKNMLRLKLAQTYLANGMMTEALGMLELLAAESPSFAVDYNLAALTGAAKFYLYRYGEAAADFSSPELGGKPEIAFWQNATRLVMGDSSAEFDFLEGDKQFFNKYPPALRQRLAIFGAETSINQNKYNAALQIIDRLHKDKQLDGMQNYVDFLLGKISAETGQVATALKLFESLSTQFDDPFVRAQAGFAHTIYALRSGKITRDDAINTLERIKFIWRDDALELNILNVLSQLYQQKPDYVMALRTLRDIERVYSTTQDALNARVKMSDIFKMLYLNGIADAMQPVEALALFREFQELTPVGKEGEELYRKIADRLVGVDLLDEAIATLSQQVKHRLEGEDRSIVGARLALIHLLNRQPAEALKVLELTNYGKNSAEINRTRNQLTAQSLIKLGRNEEALQMLEDDYSPEAQDLRLNAFWEKRQWGDVIATAEKILRNRKDITASLTEKEGEYLVMLALAYVFERDSVQLQYLRDYFSPLAKGSKYYKTFSYLTDSMAPVNHENIAEVTKELSQIQTFLSAYRNRLEKDDLSTVIQ